jgi:uncharacterized OsmC-like protein
VKVGDVRLVNPWMGCGECKVCQRGDENLCLKPQNRRRVLARRLRDAHAVPRIRHLFDIGNLKPEQAAPLACSGVTAFSALKKVADAARTSRGDHRRGRRRPDGRDARARRWARRRSSSSTSMPPSARPRSRPGATKAIDGGAADAVAQIQAATGGGAWAVIDFVGSGATVKLAVISSSRAARCGGRPFGGDVTVPTPYLPLRAHDAARLLCRQPDRHGRTARPGEAHRHAAGADPHAPLEEVNDTLNDLRAGKIVGRVVLTPRGLTEKENMDATALRAMQAPIKERYKGDPGAAMITLKAKGTLDDSNIACKVETGRALASRAASGDRRLGLELCSGDMLLEALVACAGVTLKAVSTALDIPLKSGHVSAEGDLDFRGTLGVAKDAPVGFAQIRLTFDVDTDAPQEKLDQLLKLTERYCVVYQTIKSGPPVEVKLHRA